MAKASDSSACVIPAGAGSTPAARSGYDRGVAIFASDPILPPDPDDLEMLHDREYRVRAYRVADDELLIRGAVRDQKPPGLYLAEDPDPLTIHHMQVELEVAFPSLEITGAEVLFEAYPHASCPSIVDHYHELVGLSIARGFTNRVRELFGGPRGCTHTTALLLAMGPVAVQCSWSMRASVTRRGLVPAADPRPLSPEQRQALWRSNLNTCHVWAEDGKQVALLRAGGELEMPLAIRRRYNELGLDTQGHRPD